MNQVALPTPSNEHMSMSLQLVNLIKNEPMPLSFATFMELALYAPNLGYYNRADSHIGEKGDFITAPTLSPIFAQCLSRSIQHPRNLLEIGAGTGQLAFDLLSQLAQTENPPKQYLILEKSSQLRLKQQALLSKHPLSKIITWLDDWPSEFEGTIIANEVLDAMPVHLFEATESGFDELCINWDGEKLIWQSVPASNHLLKALHDLNIDFATGYRSEINLGLSTWLKDLSNTLKKGQVLLIDYGNPQNTYYHPHRHHGTLRCFYQHRIHEDPLLWPGLQDITADVDFTAVAKAAKSEGLEVASLKSQANFLLDSGLAQIIQPLSNPEEQWKQSQALKKLLEPNEMGERIKVLELLKH